MVVANIVSGEVHRISLSTRSHIHSAVFVHVRESVYLVVASSIGVQVWSKDGTVLKYFLPLNSVVTGESGELCILLKVRHIFSIGIALSLEMYM